MDNAANAMAVGQVYIVIKLFVLQIVKGELVLNQMFVHVNLDGKVFFAKLVFAVSAYMVFVQHQSIVSAFMDMKVHTAIFQLVCLLAITVMQLSLILVLVMKVGKVESVINQCVIMIVVLRVTVYCQMSASVILAGNLLMF